MKYKFDPVVVKVFPKQWGKKLECKTSNYLKLCAAVPSITTQGKDHIINGKTQPLRQLYKISLAFVYIMILWYTSHGKFKSFSALSWL